jgi:hypothetical protein
MAMFLKPLLKISWRLPVLIYPVAEVLDNFSSSKSTFRTIKFIVFDVLKPNRLMFSWNSLSAKDVYLLYDTESGHCNVITNIKGAMAKKYIFNGWHTVYDFKPKYYKVCFLCTATSPCTKYETKYCGTGNRLFLGEKCFQNKLSLKQKDKDSLSVETSVPKLYLFGNPSI